MRCICCCDCIGCLRNLIALSLNNINLLKNRGVCNNLFLCIFPMLLVSIPMVISVIVFIIDIILRIVNNGASAESLLSQFAPAVNMESYAFTDNSLQYDGGAVCTDGGLDIGPSYETEYKYDFSRLYAYFDETGQAGLLSSDGERSGFLGLLRQARYTNDDDYCKRNPIYYRENSLEKLNDRYEDDLKMRKGVLEDDYYYNDTYWLLRSLGGRRGIFDLSNDKPPDPDRDDLSGFIGLNGALHIQDWKPDEGKFKYEVISNEFKWKGEMIHTMTNLIINSSSTLGDDPKNYLRNGAFLVAVRTGDFFSGIQKIFDDIMDGMTGVSNACVIFLLPIALSFLFPTFASRKIEDRNEGLIEYCQLYGVTEFQYELVHFLFDYGFYFAFMLCSVILSCVCQVRFFINVYCYEWIILLPIWGVTLVFMAYLFSATQRYANIADGVGTLLVFMSSIVGGLLNVFVYSSGEQPPFYYFLYPPFVLSRAFLIIISQTDKEVYLPKGHEHFWICMAWLIGETIFMGMVIVFYPLAKTIVSASLSCSKSIFTIINYQIQKIKTKGKGSLLINEENYDSVVVEKSGEPAAVENIGEESDEGTKEDNENEKDEKELEEGGGEIDSSHSESDSEKEDEKSGEIEEEKSGEEKEYGERSGEEKLEVEKEIVENIHRKSYIYTELPKFGDVDVIREKERVILNRYPEDDTSIVIKGLSKSYSKLPGAKKVVKDVYLSLRQRECFALLGPNGAGKTTLLKLLTGQISPTGGTAGYNILTSKNLIRKYVSICPQFDRLFSKLTVREHLLFFARLRGISIFKQREFVKELLKKVSLFEHKRKYAGNLSGGMRRRLSIAIALIGGLDPNTREGIWNLIEEIKKERCLVLTTHSMEEAERLCDRICIMTNGSLRCLGTLHNIKRKYSEGYQLIVNVGDRKYLGLANKYIRECFPTANEARSFAESLYYRIPQEHVEFSKIFLELSPSRASRVGIRDWTLNQASLEEVFLRFAEGHDTNKDAHKKQVFDIGLELGEEIIGEDPNLLDFQNMEIRPSEDKDKEEEEEDKDENEVVGEKVQSLDDEKEIGGEDLEERGGEGEEKKKSSSDSSDSSENVSSDDDDGGGGNNIENININIGDIGEEIDI